MSVNITPGYDFSINEIPTRAKFLLQAEVTITNIDAERIVSTDQDGLIAIEDTSNATLASSEGALWIDAQGTLWGRNRWGLVQVRRPTGGWESNRFEIFSWAPLYGPINRQGTAYIPRGGSIPGALLEDGSITIRYPVGTGYRWGVGAETAVSGVIDQPRVVYRGQVPVWVDADQIVADDLYMGFLGASDTASLPYDIDTAKGVGTGLHSLGFESAAVDFVGGSNQSMTMATVYPGILGTPL
jgi:hypothetical protein